jgi:UDP-galactopyranose mutase
MSGQKKILVIGAGFSGAVMAERLANSIDCKILVIDERDHIGGNCHSKRDEETGIMVHTYGPHVFNTDNLEVWKYIQQFGAFKPFINRIKALYKGQVYSLPINLHTINQFYGKAFSPSEAKIFLQQICACSSAEPTNFEEQAIKTVGKDLYYAFLYGYTKKQWGCEPKDLPASIVKRMPVRFDYNDNYYDNEIQAIPVNGYTSLFEKMLDHPSIEVILNTKFTRSFDTSGFDHIIYTGPVDAFFEYKHGRLSYRTVYFEKHIANGDYQGNPIINFSEESVPYTRIHEHKHFAAWEDHDKTVYFKEYSKETTEADTPYYPKRLKSDMEILQKYNEEVKRLTRYTFLGRLATYRYMDMHHVIWDSMLAAKNLLKQLNNVHSTVIV